MRISYEDDLKGRAVIDGTGRMVGSVEALLIDSQSWRVEAMRVKLNRDAADQVGAEHRVFQPAILEIPVSLVHAAGDAVILNVPAASLRELRPAAEVAAAPT
jgi:sporulation protein YlmC with PRC-barrel domain